MCDENQIEKSIFEYQATVGLNTIRAFPTTNKLNKREFEF